MKKSDEEPTFYRLLSALSAEYDDLRAQCEHLRAQLTIPAPPLVPKAPMPPPEELCCQLTQAGLDPDVVTPFQIGRREAEALQEAQKEKALQLQQSTAPNNNMSFSIEDDLFDTEGLTQVLSPKKKRSPKGQTMEAISEVAKVSEGLRAAARVAPDNHTNGEVVVTTVKLPGMLQPDREPAQELHTELACQNSQDQVQHSGLSASSMPTTHPSRDSHIAKLSQEEGHHRVWDNNTSHLNTMYDEIKKQTTELGKRQNTRSWAYRVNYDRRFGFLCAMAILANLVFMCVQTSVMLNAEFARLDLGGQPTSYTEVWLYGEGGFLVWFTIELAIRIAATGWGFIFGHEKLWNMFDFAVVGLSAAEVISDLYPNMISTDAGISVLRTARVYRIVRIMRFSTGFTIVRNIKTMLYSLMGCGAAFLSASLMLFVLMWVFAILFMDSARRALSEATVDEQIRLQEDYGSPWITLWTLLGAITGGFDWMDVAYPLCDINPVGNGFLFLTYIFCMYLGVMNILNGIFVNAALQSSALDREIATDCQLREQKKLVKQMMLLFHEADIDASGSVTWEEFQSYLNNADIRAYFMALDLDMDSIGKIFKLIDEDESGFLALDEFLEGCLRLKGYAKMVDLSIMEDKITAMFQSLENLLKTHPNVEHNVACGAAGACAVTK